MALTKEKKLLEAKRFSAMSRRSTGRVHRGWGIPELWNALAVPYAGRHVVQLKKTTIICFADFLCSSSSWGSWCFFFQGLGTVQLSAVCCQCIICMVNKVEWRSSPIACLLAVDSIEMHTKIHGRVMYGRVFWSMAIDGVVCIPGSSSRGRGRKCWRWNWGWLMVKEEEREQAICSPLPVSQSCLTCQPFAWGLGVLWTILKWLPLHFRKLQCSKHNNGWGFFFIYVCVNKDNVTLEHYVDI